MLEGVHRGGHVYTSLVVRSGDLGLKVLGCLGRGLGPVARGCLVEACECVRRLVRLAGVSLVCWG